jgi:hypothetical protein
LLVEEANHLLSPEEIERLPVARGEKKDGNQPTLTRQEAIELRQREHDKIKEILGNGSFIREYPFTRAEVEAFVDALEARHQLREPYREIYNKLNGPQKKDLTEPEIAELKKTQSELSPKLEELAKVASPLEAKAFYAYRQLVDAKRFPSQRDFALYYDTDSTEIIAKLRSAMIDLRPQEKLTFRRTLIFVTANPNEIFGSILAQSGQGPGGSGKKKLHPDWTREMTRRIPRSAMEDWFHHKFGTDPAWDSRWNISAWMPDLPPSQADYDEMIGAELENFANRYQTKLEAAGIKSRLTFDPSVHQMLNDALVDPVEGARKLYGGIPQLLPSFMAGLRAQIIMGNETKPFDVEVTFDPASSSLVAWRDGRKTRFYEESVPVVSVASSPAVASGEDHAVRRQARHQVGHLLGGMLFMGSVPKQLDLHAPGEATEPHQLWRAPNVDSYPYYRDHIMSLLAGYQAEALFESVGFVSPGARLDVARGKELLADILTELHSQQRLLTFSPTGPSSRPLSSYVRRDLKGTPIYRVLGQEGGTAQQAFDDALEASAELLIRHRELVDALTNQLIEKGSLSARELKRLVARHGRSLPLPLVRKLLATPEGGVAHQTCGEATASLSSPPLKPGRWDAIYRAWTLRAYR